MPQRRRRCWCVYNSHVPGVAYVAAVVRAKSEAQEQNTVWYTNAKELSQVPDEAERLPKVAEDGQEAPLEVEGFVVFVTRAPHPLTPQEHGARVREKKREVYRPSATHTRSRRSSHNVLDTNCPGPREFGLNLPIHA